MAPRRAISLLLASAALSASASFNAVPIDPRGELEFSEHSIEPRGDLHFPLHARQTNKDGSVPTYKSKDAGIEARVSDLLPRMTLEEKVSQLYVLASL